MNCLRYPNLKCHFRCGPFCRLSGQGRKRNDGPASTPSFWLPLDDLGSGRVNTTPLIAVGDGTPTFSRATPAQALLSDGTFATVLSGVARSWYLPGGIYAGYIGEGVRTNRCVRSQSFGSDWSAVGTPTRSAATTILGVCQLDTIGDDSAAALEGYTLPVTFVGDGVKAVSVAVKKDTSTSSAIRLRDGTAGADRLLAVVTWSGNVPVVTMTTGTDQTGTPQQLGTSGTYILSFQTTAVTAASANQLEIYPATDAALAVGGTGNIQVGIINEEDALYPSSPIITTGSVVARNDDLLAYPAGNMNVGTNPGSAYCEYVLLPTLASATRRNVLYVSTVGNNRFELRGVNDNLTTPLFVYGTGGGIATAGAAAISSGLHKTAISYGPAGGHLSVDGAVATSDPTASNLGSATIKPSGDGSSAGFCAIKNIRFWQQQFSDNQLQSLTS